MATLLMIERRRGARTPDPDNVIERLHCRPDLGPYSNRPHCSPPVPTSGVRRRRSAIELARNERPVNDAPRHIHGPHRATTGRTNRSDGEGTGMRPNGRTADDGEATTRID